MLDIGILATIGTPYLAIIPPVVTAYLIVKRKIKISRNPLNMGLFLLFFWALYSGLVNKSLYSTLASFGILFYLSISIYLQQILAEEKKVEEFLYKVQRYSLLAGVLGIIEKIASYFVDMTWTTNLFYKGPYIPSVENYRIYSTFGNPNVTGAWFAAMVLLSLYIFEHSQGKKKLFSLISIVISISALIFTGSKGATIGLLVAIWIYAIFIKNRNTRIALLCTFGIIALLALFSPEINHALYSTSRDSIWVKCIDLFTQKPITGWGIFGIVETIKKTHAHNIWISMLSMFGIVGFSLYIWIKIHVFRSLILLYKNKVKLVPLLASLQALIICHGIVDFIIMAPQGGILFFSTSAAIIGLTKKYKTSISITENEWISSSEKPQSIRLFE